MKPEASLDNLSIRIEKLERQNFRLKQLGFLLLLAVVSFFLMAQTKVSPVRATKALEAGKVILKDGRGTVRAELGLFLDRPALVFYDNDGNALLSMGAEPEGAGLAIFDANARKAAVLNSSQAGTVLSLFEAGRKRLNVSVSAQGPAIGMLGKDGEAKSALGLTEGDNPYLHLFGAAEQGGAQLLAAPDRTVLRFFDSSDRARAVFGIVDKESDPGLALNDINGRARAILMLTSDGASLDFFDKEGIKIVR